MKLKGSITVVDGMQSGNRIKLLMLCKINYIQFAYLFLDISIVGLFN